MAISYVSSEYDVQTIESDTLTVPAPASIANGDILVAMARAYRASGSATIALPAGWTELANYAPSTYRAFTLGWKRAASESGDYDFTMASSSLGIGEISAFRGCLASGSPVDVFSNTAYITNNTTIRAATVTTTVDNTMLWAAGMMGDGGTSVTPPTSMTECVDFYSSANTMLIAAAYVAQAATGASGDKDFTASAGQTNKHAFLLALKPAVTASIVPVLMAQYRQRRA